MRNVLIASVAFVLAIFIASPVSAEPTINGPTGLIINPTADITELEHAWISLNFFDNNGNTVWTTNLTGTVSEQFEISAGGTFAENGGDGLTFGGKWLFMRESENRPGAAAGVLFNDVSGSNTTTFYAVASKFFYFGEDASENASIHGGINLVTGDSDDTFEFFGGLDVMIVEDFIAIAEFNTDESNIFEGFTFGLRYYFGPQVTGQIATIDGDLTFGGSFIF
jgi:hypothetical protein